jgi:hypothetical protein
MANWGVFIFTEMNFSIGDKVRVTRGVHAPDMGEVKRILEKSIDILLFSTRRRVTIRKTSAERTNTWDGRHSESRRREEEIDDIVNSLESLTLTDIERARVIGLVARKFDSNINN